MCELCKSCHFLSDDMNLFSGGVTHYLGIGVIMDKLRRAVPYIPNSGSRGADEGSYLHIAF